MAVINGCLGMAKDEDGLVRSQRLLLCALAGPGNYLPTGNRVSESLVERGLCVSHDENGRDMVTITIDGLRRLLREVEQGSMSLKPMHHGPGRS